MDPSPCVGFARFQQDAWLWTWNLYGSIDARHVTLVMPKALEAAFTGGEVFANANTVMCHSNAEPVATIFLAVALTDGGESNETRLSVEKATRMLGYQPLYC